MWRSDCGEIDVGILKVIGKSSTTMAGDVVKEDLRLTWSKGNMGQVALAEKTFREYVNKGWLAISEVSGKRTQIFTFNPDLEEIILAPFAIGG